MTLTARPVTDGDCRLMWEWVNDPAVQESAFHGGAIAWASHVSWFNAKRADPRCRIYVLHDRESGRPVAQVRFEIQTDGIADVDLSVAAPERGRGRAAEALRVAAAEIFTVPAIRGIRAYIKAENERSIRAFARAGFVRGRTVWVAGQQAITMTLARVHERVPAP